MESAHTHIYIYILYVYVINLYLQQSGMFKFKHIIRIIWYPVGILYGSSFGTWSFSHMMPSTRSRNLASFSVKLQMRGEAESCHILPLFTEVPRTHTEKKRNIRWLLVLQVAVGYQLDKYIYIYIYIYMNGYKWVGGFNKKRSFEIPHCDDAPACSVDAASTKPRMEPESIH